MAKVKITGHASGTGVLTVTAPNTSTDRTITLPDATGTLLTEVADNAVTLAKMAGLARGKIIYGDSSGDPAALTVGSSGQALVSDGTDISWGSGGAISTYSNSTNNRVITSVDSSSVNSEANLTFDGSLLTVNGEITVTTLDIGGTNVTTTAAEINLIDGGTARGTDAVATGDGILINDGGTMKMTNVDTVSTYFASHSVGGTNIVTTGALNAGSITSGFTSIDVGAGAITTTGVITGGTVEATTDTAAGDNAAIGYTSAEGLILTGQGSTSDVTLKNDADATVFTVPTGTDDILFPDSAKAMWGAGSDLQIYHSGSHSYVDDQGAGNLYLRGSNNVSITNAAGADMGNFASAGAVDLYHNGSSKLTTTAVGATITGTVIATTDTDTSNSGSITLDFATNQNFVLTLTGNVTLANPSTEAVGQSGFIAFIQDGTGSRTVSLGTDYETAAAAGLTLTATASATDLVPYLVVASNRILLGTPQLAFA